MRLNAQQLTHDAVKNNDIKQVKQLLDKAVTQINLIYFCRLHEIITTIRSRVSKEKRRSIS
jgi:hypothetical protein